MSANVTGAHQLRFFRSGGFDQVRIETVADLRALDQLDLKLWASLACPVKGLEFDERTLRYIDTDGDGRIRAPEILAAVHWALENLADPEVLFSGQELPLDAINRTTAEGEQLFRSARHILHNLGRSEATALTVDDTADLARIFPPAKPNGDGLVPVAMARDERIQGLIQDVIDSLGAETDRCGEPGISQEKIDQFFEEVTALQAWRARLHQESESLKPLGESSEAAVASYQAVASKIEDFFMRAQFAAYDSRAAVLMNGSEAELSQLSSQSLHMANEEAVRMPLAQVSAERKLPLVCGVNPAWVKAVAAFRDQVVQPLLGDRDELDFSEWQEIQSRLGAHLAWLAAKPAVQVEGIEEARLQDYVESNARAELQALIARDKSVTEAAASTLAADKLIRFQRFLVPLLNNFVALRDFYSGKKAIFQTGTLYLDGRSFDLCALVTDTAKHADLAAFSRTYLAYLNCTCKESAEKITIVAAVTAGGAGNLMVGRNGVFYDRKGQDWDATIVKIVENPVSLRDAFWSPYRRIGKLISEQVQKMAASKEQAFNDSAAAGVAGAATKLGSGAAPSAMPVPFDIARFVGIFAAIGLALGAIGTALAAVVTGLLSLKWWQTPLLIMGVVLLISGPAMVMAWFKLRARNLAPILDANGWAVNTEAKINIPFGTALTHLAKLPEGARRSLVDPYASRQRYLWWLLALVIAVGGGIYGAKNGWFSYIETALEAESESVS